MTECVKFLEQWTDDPNSIKPIFEHFKEILSGCEGANLTFKARPGISYSLRGVCPEQDRELFVMVDVVDDDPSDRWLSICFYDDQVSDPDDIGDWAPEGLGGLDARCFNIEEKDNKTISYVEDRIREAWDAAHAVA